MNRTKKQVEDGRGNIFEGGSKEEIRMDIVVVICMIIKKLLVTKSQYKTKYLARSFTIK